MSEKESVETEKPTSRREPPIDDEQPSLQPPSMERIEQLVQTTGYIIFTVTRYVAMDDVRFRACLEMIAQCHKHAVPVVVVDSSPNNVYEVLESSGAILYRQTFKGRKGAALREAAGIASKLPGVVPDYTLLCWQEPEKVDMVRHWQATRLRSDEIMMAYRGLANFERTYPCEQFHSELYGNLYLDAVATRELAKVNKRLLPSVDYRIQNVNEKLMSSIDCKIAQEISESKQKLPRIDWHFGPLCFKAKHVGLWTKYQGGDSYDAQLVPIVHAMRKGISVSSVYVDYEAPLEMKEQEEGNVEFIEKRLAQLAELDPRVKQAWTEDFYC